MHYSNVMFRFKEYVFCPMLAAAAVFLGSTAYAAEPETVSPVEIAVTLPAAESVKNIDLSAPETAPAGAVFSDEGVTISRTGAYRLTGTLQGRVLVDADGPVELILAGVSLQGRGCLETNTKDPLTLTMEAGTLNVLTDGLTAADDNTPAVITAKGALIIGGEGSLTVVAGGSDGLECKDGVTLAGGSLYIKAADEGIQSRGPVSITGGSTRIVSAGDGIAAEAGRITAGDITLSGGTLSITGQSRGLDAEEGNILLTGGELTIDSTDDGLRALDVTQTGGILSITTRGYTPADATVEETIAGDGIDGGTVSISGGELTITSAGDGIQALTALTVTDGVLSITSGGGGGDALNHSGGDMFGPPGRSWSQSAAADDPSTKGLKSDGDITVTGGRIGLSTADDSLHCVRLCTIEGGELYIYSSDDAIHSDDMILINGGDITVYDCFEGLEGFAVEVHGGNILLYAVNDCVNANGPEGWGWGGNTSVTDSVSGYDTTYYWQSGGWADYVVYSYGSNMGDGLDSNGSMYITGGHLTVSTPGTFMENGIDSGFGNFIISGGEVMAGGAAAMQPTPSSTTEQCVAVISGISIQADTTIYLYDSDGNKLWNYTIPNYTSCLIVSHPEMTQGNVYTVTYGENSTTLDFTSSNAISAGSRSSSRGGRPF